ncbi:MAG: hypothetical protein HUU55_21225 [Myxococcales bacterium]|nr:hypothetical protein [Myxococcales bacterium]
MSLDKTMTNRRQWSEHVVSAGESHAPALAAKLAAESSACGIEPPADLEGAIRWMAALLDYRTGNMVAAEVALKEEGVDDVPYRDSRDKAVAELSAQLSGIRTLASLHPPAVAEKWVVKTPIPENTQLLCTYAKNAVGALSSDTQIYTLIGGLTFVPKDAALALKSALDQLIQALDDLTREGHEWDTALNHRDAAVAAWGHTYSGIARVFEGLFLLANEPMLADRARPTIRKRRGEEEAPPLPATQADAAADAPSEPA